MPGAYRPALAGAIFKGEHPKRRGERVGGPGSTAGGASVRRGQRVFLSAPSSLASACEGSAPSAEPASGGTARGAARGQRALSGTYSLASAFEKPEAALPAGTAARYI